MSPVVRKSPNIATRIYCQKLLFPFASSKIYVSNCRKVWSKHPTVCGPIGHGAGAFGPPEFRYARKLVIISQFQSSMVIQAKK